MVAGVEGVPVVCASVAVQGADLPAVCPEADVTNTRVSLWPGRWPAIALDECVAKVEAAEPEDREQVKWDLPCLDCPEQMACLNAKRKELGPLLYDREILTRPRASESSLFPWELFERCLAEGEDLVSYYNKQMGVESRYGVASAWDLAWSERAGGDFLVRMTGRIDRQTGIKRLLDIERWQRISFDGQIDLITSSWARFRDDVVVIESTAAQQVWVQKVSSSSAVPVMGMQATDKRDFAAGVPSLIMQLENRRWEFPYRPGSYHFEHLHAFFAEAEAFGWTDGKLQGVGEHDDTVMAWWYLDRALTMMSIPPERREHHRGVVRGRYI